VPKPSGQTSKGHGHTRGRFQKGGAGGPGRASGSRNMSTALLREAFLNAFDSLGGQADLSRGGPWQGLDAGGKS